MARTVRSGKSSYLIGVDLGGTHVRAGLVGRGRLLQLATRATPARGTSAEVLAQLCEVIEEVYHPRVKGIGVGVPSLVDEKTGVLFDTTNIPAWTRVPLRKQLEKRYGIPVAINNDANCFVLGEKHFGLGKKYDCFVGLILGTGLGAGIISGGRLHSGVNGAAGEFGTIPYRDSIVEHYASGQFFHRRAWVGSELAHAAEQGSPEALKLFAEFGEHLGFAVQVILYSLAPPLIVFGGSVSQSLRYFEPALRESLSGFAYPSLVQRLKLKVSRLQNAGVLGAASLV